MFYLFFVSHPVQYLIVEFPKLFAERFNEREFQMYKIHIQTVTKITAQVLHKKTN